MADPGNDLEVVRAAIDCVSELDIDGVLELTTEDLVLEFPFRGDGGPRRLEGMDARKFMRALPKLFSQMKFSDVTVHGPVPSGVIVAEYRSNGVTRAGRPYPNAYVGFFELREQRIFLWREYFDPLVVDRAFPS
jgi:ketosteroid isomerase-like protein